MPIPETAARFDEILAAVRAATAIRPPAPPAEAPAADGGSVFVSDQIERITYHDFASYEMVFDPWAGRDPRQNDAPGEPTPPPQDDAPPPPSYLPADLVDLDDLAADAEAAVAYFLDTEVREALEDGVGFDPAPAIRLIYRFRYQCSQELVRHYQPDQIPHRVESMLIFFIETFLADVLEPFQRMSAAQQAEFFAQHYDRAVRDWAIRARNLEMPWVVGQGTIQRWLDAGYEVGGPFGRVPTRLSAQTGVGGPTIDGWTMELAHEYAWTHDRNANAGSSGQPFISGAYAPNGTTTYFAAPGNYAAGPVAVAGSTVLLGALAILAATPPLTPSEEEQLSAAARAALGRFGALIGHAPSGAPPKTARDLYSFEPYPAGSINLGIRVLYRQAWRPRGIQPGELVRTIPLAPGQKERFSVKVQLRNRLTREMEDKSSTETTQESTSQTKNSSEIVEEAARSNKWHIDASANGSYNLGGVFSVQATTSTGYAQEGSEASRDTKSRLAETMQKTARTSRRESRLQVSTEREETFESERSSEITNPNQEIAVTCFYETVQQIYTVKTALEGIEPVLYVAERLPRPEELNIDWLRRHDWILNRVLLDESFRETLALVSTQHPDFVAALSAQALGLDEVARLSRVLDRAEESLATIQQLPGNIANTYEATLNAYQSAVATARSRLEQVQQLLHRIQRLIDHVADNILYYHRAIWSEEDPDRRRMRYASLRMPTRFRPSIDMQNVETDPVTGHTIYTGAWEPDPASWQPLSAIIHPAGPIAYAGNYSVFRLRHTESNAGISRVIRLAHQAYYEAIPPDIQVSPPGRGAAVNAGVSIENDDFYSGDGYLLRVSVPPPPPVGGPIVGPSPVPGVPARNELQLTLLRQEFDGRSVDLTAAVLPNQGRIPGFQPIVLVPLTLRFDGLQLVLRGALQDGDEITLLPKQPLLVDPEIKYRRLLDPTASLAELHRQIEEENTDDIVVDTNNIWLNLVTGTGTVLEDFKLEHRRIDVEIARAELVRRYLRLDQNVLADPDIEKQVIIKGPARASRAGENEAVAEDPPPAPAPPSG